nr:uncharacterized protein LOC113821243 [Penaeus vannamei]
MEKRVELGKEIWKGRSSSNYSGIAITMPEAPKSEEPPILTRVREVISKLKGWKAVGICGMLAELLKAGAEPMARGLHNALATIWQFHSSPSDLFKGMVIHLWKGIDQQPPTKAPKTSVVWIHSKQFHSRPYPSALSHFLEHRNEFGCGLCAPYIDSLHHGSVWELLRHRGIPAWIIGLIASLNIFTKCAVKCDGGLLNFFPVNSGTLTADIVAILSEEHKIH